MWGNAVITDVHSFYLFFIALFFASAVLYLETGAPRWLYAMAATFATFWLNIPFHFILAPLFLVVLALRDVRLSGSLLATVMASSLATWCVDHFGGRFEYVVGVCVLTTVISTAILPGRRILLGVVVSFLLAHLPWLYLPLASMANPPIDWGVASTWSGFVDMVTRGQYGAPDWFANLCNVQYLARHLDMVGATAMLNLGLPAVLLAVLSLWWLRDAGLRKVWIALFASAVLTSVCYCLVCFLGWDQPSRLSAMFVWLPYLLLLAIFAGLGLVALVSAMPRRIGTAAAVFAFAGMLAVPLSRGWTDADAMAIWGQDSRHGHDFGWQFGAYALDGANAIRTDLKPGEALPDSDYPPPMEQNAILFGGTEPGRFVSEYMVFSANFRPDVRVLTQNALADETYMRHVRRYFGTAFSIPTEPDVTQIAEEVWRAPLDLNHCANGIGYNDEYKGITAIGGIMLLNAAIARHLFETNKVQHTFYLEESYSIPWMYPHLVPNGLFFRLRNEPLAELPADLVKKDLAFWDWFSRRLLTNPAYAGDYEARRTFSKLRCSNAGLYEFRKMMNEAEHGFRQAVALYPLSPEANFRLADCLTQQGRFAEAVEVTAHYCALDPTNERMAEFLSMLRKLAMQDVRRRELERELAGGANMAKAIELLGVYRELGSAPLFHGLAEHLMSSAREHPETRPYLAEAFMGMNCFDEAAVLLVSHLKANPDDGPRRVDLAACYNRQIHVEDAVRELADAIKRSEDMRDKILADRRFDSLRHCAEYRDILERKRASRPPSESWALPNK